MTPVPPAVRSPELYLRLEGERMLVLSEGHGGINPLGEIASAFIAVGLLSGELARQIVTDYNLASGLRQPANPFWMHHQPAGPSGLTVAPVAPVVTGCDDPDPRPDGSILYAVLGDTSTELAVTYSGQEDWQLVAHRFPQPQGFPQSLSLTDDTGRTLSAHFSGGGGGGAWNGRFVTNGPLSQHTQWLELGGRRVQLLRPETRLRVEVEGTSTGSPAGDYLRHRIAVSDGVPQLGDDDPVLEALLATGALSPDDPVIEELAAIRHAVSPFPAGFTTGAGYGSAAVQFPGGAGGSPAHVSMPTTIGLPEQWQAQHRAMSAGPLGVVPLGVATPLMGSQAAVVFALISEADAFRIDTMEFGSPGGHGPVAVVAESPAFAWWAQDDRGGWYRGQWQGWSGSENERRGDIAFSPPLDPNATVLRLMPTLPHQRAVIEVGLPAWEAQL